MSATLTRQQRRIKERIETQAKEQLEVLLHLFYSVFMENEPEGEAVKLKRKELSAKWKMYCHDRNLNKEALKIFDVECEGIIERFNSQLKETV